MKSEERGNRAMLNVTSKRVAVFVSGGVVAFLFIVGGVQPVFSGADAPEEKSTREKREDRGAKPESPKPKHADYKAIQGTWRVIKLKFGKKTVDPKKFKVIISERFLELAGRRRSLMSLLGYQLDPSAKPKGIDVGGMSIHGSGGGKMEGIYRLDGDRLKICSGKKRPKRFAVRQGSDDSLFVLERESTEAKTIDQLQAEKERAHKKTIDESPLKPTVTIDGAKGEVDALVFDANGRLLAAAWREESSSGRDTPTSVVSVWSVKNGKRRREFTVTGSGVEGLRFSPDGKRLAVGCHEAKEAVIWDLKSGEEVLRLSGAADWVTDVVYSTDGRRVILGRGGSWLYDAATGEKILLTPTPRENERFLNLVFSDDGAKVAGRLWMATTRDQPASQYHPQVRVWSPETGQQIASFDLPERHTGSLAFSADGTRLTSNNRKQPTTWDIESGREVEGPHTLREYPVRRPSPDGRFRYTIASTPTSGAVYINEAETGTRLLMLPHPAGGVRSHAVSADGKWLACGSGHRYSSTQSEIRIWNLKSLIADLELTRKDLPGLFATINDTELKTETRAKAIRSLLRMGADAREAAPDLVALLREVWLSATLRPLPRRSKRPTGDRPGSR